MHCNKITVKSIFNYIESIPRNIIDFELVKRNGKYIENIDCIQPLTDKIIQATGHYCESHSSDIIPQINELLKELQTGEINIWHFIFAIKKDGVDNLKQFQKRTNGIPDLLMHNYYRKIYAVNITKVSHEDMINIELKDMTDIIPIDIAE